MAIQIHITFKSRDEKKRIARLAKDAGLSFSNYVRQCLGLEPLQHGDAKRFKRKAAEQPEERNEDESR